MRTHFGFVAAVILLAASMVGCTSGGQRAASPQAPAPTIAEAPEPPPEPPKTPQQLAEEFRYFHEAQYRFDDYLVGLLKPKRRAEADYVQVYKGARRMLLWSRGQVIRAYDVALGFSPVGPKWREGDGRTPEGRYEIDWRNPESEFYLSLHISYPNAADAAAARARGVSPGGAIMIHGEGITLASNARPRHGDWTNGCIAVSNAEMEEIWSLVPDGTPIDIYP